MNDFDATKSLFERLEIVIDKAEVTVFEKNHYGAAHVLRIKPFDGPKQVGYPAFEAVFYFDEAGKFLKLSILE